MTEQYETLIREEVSNWPGASVKFELRSKHAQAVVQYGGSSRFVVIPASPSDSARGARNSLPHVRRELMALGASRRPKPIAQRKPRSDAPRPQRQVLAHIERAPVKLNPFEALAGMVVTQPAAPLSFWQRMVSKARAFRAKIQGENP